MLKFNEKIGKLLSDELRECVTDIIKHKRDDVQTSVEIGQDCAVFESKDCKFLITCDPITGAANNIGGLSIDVCANDIAASGGEPMLAMLTILAPPKATLLEIKEVVRGAEDRAKLLNIQIVGGHTEFTDAVVRVITSTTIVGKLYGDDEAYKLSIGDDIVLTKYAALEGTAILVSDNEFLLKSVLSDDEIEYGKSLVNSLSVLKEAKLAKSFCNVLMHDVTEGGILGGIYEVLFKAGLGAEINLKSVPILDVTKKVCEYFNIDPYRLIASGSMAIFCKNGDRLVKKLIDNGVNASVVGKVAEGLVYAIDDCDKKHIVVSARDELFKVSSSCLNNN